MVLDPSSIRKILFITLSNIGDAILTTPSLDLVRRFFGKAHITVMVGPRAVEVFEDHPQIDRLWIYDKAISLWQKIPLLMKLKAEKFDLVVDLRNTLIPLFIQPRYATPLIRRRVSGHAIHRHLDRLRTLGIEGCSSFVLPDRAEDQKHVEDLMLQKNVDENKSLVLLAPGAANRLKRWDLIKFKALGERLRMGKNLEIAIVGPKEDKDEFDLAFPPSQWINLVGELSLMQLGSLIKKAKLLITNDSGPMHLATALRTRVLAIFGPTDPKIYGPYGAMNLVVRLELSCSPCMEGFCRLKTHECMKSLTVEKVHQAVLEMLH